MSLQTIAVKNGDIMECVMSCDNMTTGKHYVILRCYENNVMVLNDKLESEWLHVSRFKHVH